jgi:hypothetical protein
MSGVVPPRRIVWQLNFKSKGLSPTKYTRKNRICPRLVVIGYDVDGNAIHKTPHVNKVSTKLSLEQSNMLVLSKTRVNFNYKRSRFTSKVIKGVYIRNDNYTCKERRMIKRTEARALANAA